MPEDGEVAGLLALMLLSEARRPARVSPDGRLVPLDQQDRRVWDARADRRGSSTGPRAPGQRDRPGPISDPGGDQCRPHLGPQRRRDRLGTDSCSCTTSSQILDPSPIVALNRAIAVAQLDGPHVALVAVDRLQHQLSEYHAFHATRADLLRRLGRGQDARVAYDEAIRRAGNPAEMAVLTLRRDHLG